MKLLFEEWGRPWKGNTPFPFPSQSIPTPQQTQQNPHLLIPLKLKGSNFRFENMSNAYLLGIYEDGMITLKWLARKVYFKNIILNLGILLLPFFKKTSLAKVEIPLWFILDSMKICKIVLRLGPHISQITFCSKNSMW